MENNNFKPFPFEQLKQKKEPEKTAVAIAYEPGEKAPKILATGKGQVAEKIIEKAKESQVPTYKDNKLASTLSKLQIGDMIPPELYEVVAEILVFVDDMDRMKAKQSPDYLQEVPPIPLHSVFLAMPVTVKICSMVNI